MSEQGGDSGAEAFLRPPPESVSHLDEATLRSAWDEARLLGDRVAERRCSGLLAEWLMANGEDARPLARRALELAREHAEDPLDDAVMANRIRSATARFHQGEHREAEEELQAAVDDLEAADRDRYRDFAHQHLGKCLAEQGRYREALVHFRAALAARTDPGLRASSREAIDLALIRLEAVPGG